ncbi:hypothetical protein LCGC14_0390070 [marine sediment metagenome]|uniref:DOD-type homing endonuclease domain-containing protein n=1 Tax=marine sediment metagenome TaxID=412755 RepID=A0A0F9SZX9_9ZZZZ
MAKLYVLDTSVIISNPYCINGFPNENIVIPASVLNELDKIKTHSGDTGRNARVFIRLLDELSDKGDISKGVKTDKNTNIKIDVKNYDTSNFGDASYVDNKILACAAHLNNNNRVIVLSGDVNMRIRARAFGMGSQDHNDENKASDELYSGARIIHDTSLGNKLKKSKMLCASSELKDMAPNECILFKDENDEGIALGRKIGNNIKIINSQKPWGLDSKNIEQAYAMDLLLDPKVPLVTLSGKAGTGKAQPLTAKILTPNGFVSMGSILPNDLIIGQNGKCKKITSVHPQGIKKIYRVYFSDKTFTECCDDHLWQTKTCQDRWNNKNGTVKSLKEIRKTLRYGKYNKRNHSIPMVLPVEFAHKEVPIKPYLLGALLGDGCSSDAFIVEKCAKLLPENIKLIKKPNNKYDYYITKGYRSNKENQIITALRTLELSGLKSYEKYIPHIYKINNIQTRTEILQGLMDTDGFCRNKNKNKFENVFYTTSSRLANDVQFLAQSLGCKATISNKQTSFVYKNEKKQGRPSFAVYISPPPGLQLFTLPRKTERFTERTKYLPTKYIDKIEYAGDMDAKCIYIDSPDHLYITDNFIVTHNTLLSVACGLEAVISDKQYNNLIIYRPIQPVGTDMGYLPGELADKLEPWMSAIHDSMDYLASRSKKHRKNGNGNGYGWRSSQYSDKVRMEALTYIRGRSIANSFILMDETQNVSKEEIKTILTRVGYGTKIILTGDIEQIDSNHLDAMNNGLTYIINKFKDSPLSGHINLTQGERSPLATYAADIL